MLHSNSASHDPAIYMDWMTDCHERHPSSIAHFAPLSMGDNKASFSPSVRKKIVNFYGSYCSICLNDLTSPGGECAHLLDSAEDGKAKLDLGVQLGLLPRNYQRSGKDNGIYRKDKPFFP